MEGIDIWAPAKINLFLNVLGKREDGYHEIETLYQAISIWDTIHIMDAECEGIRIESSDPALVVDERNLVFKAAYILKEYTGIGRGLGIRIQKRIPISMGLGGGSSDAASTLIGINKLWKLGLGKDELMKIGRMVGADVPFFLTGWSCALGRGIGEILTPVHAKQLYFVLIIPGFGISSRWAYENLKIGLTKESYNTKLIIDLLEGGKIEEFLSNLYNALEGVCIEKYPCLLRFKERLIQEGAMGALMSGSGPTIFGIAPSKREAQRIRSRLMGMGERILVVRSLICFERRRGIGDGDNGHTGQAS